MPYGHNVARCLRCGKEWMVGDCIPVCCPECEAAGHTNGFSLGCPVCFPPEYIERRNRIIEGMKGKEGQS